MQFVARLLKRISLPRRRRLRTLRKERLIRAYDSLEAVLTEDLKTLPYGCERRRVSTDLLALRSSRILRGL